MAGPLRRFGTYTIPDFAEGRFDSRNMRKMAVVFALTISFFYMMPQMKGAGITLARLLGSPYWVGVVVVGTGHRRQRTPRRHEGRPPSQGVPVLG